MLHKNLTINIFIAWLLFASGNNFAATNAPTESLHIAVASNFLSTLKTLVVEFKKQHNIKIIISTGSTGKLHSQITHGAPYHIFLSADQKHPELLVQQELASKESLIHYATGALVLWSPEQPLSSKPLNDLNNASFTKIAIANLKHAPYGQAAYNLLIRQEKFQTLKPKLIYADNIAQVFHWLAAKQVSAGFVAKALLMDWQNNTKKIILNTKHTWEVPNHLYNPVQQYMVLLNQPEPSVHAKLFSEFIQSSLAVNIIRNNGYQI